MTNNEPQKDMDLSTPSPDSTTANPVPLQTETNNNEGTENPAEIAPQVEGEPRSANRGIEENNAESLSSLTEILNEINRKVYINYL